MEYKGYVGSVEFSEKDGLFFGKVQGIRSLISYEGTNATELVSDFHGAVDDYLALCEAEGISPEIAYKGSLNVRFKNSDIHRRAAIYAIMHARIASTGSGMRCAFPFRIATAGNCTEDSR